MLEALPKAAFALLADSELLKRLAERYGMGRSPVGARRLVAGETIDEARDAAAGLERRGFLVALDYLEPLALSTASAADATRRYVDVVTHVGAGDQPRTLIVKLSQVGLAVDRATGLDNLRRVLDAAAPAQMMVRLGVERAPAIDATLDIAETLWQIGYRNLGISIAAALRRSPADVARFAPLGISIRMIRSAGREPREISLRTGSEVAAAFRALAERLLRESEAPAFATHDAGLLTKVGEIADRFGIGAERYELQLRRGVRTDLQQKLHARGRRIRVRLPFGHEWFAYVMRQFGNRPGILFRR